ncbi:glycosyltransferase [Carboxylicivirga taeanensis]|uniref:glycosyltransferase n=1 Tax=Carboxylicivirga taeanensis TaxID=1416875 RepID=UPI003F6DDEA0
MDKLFAKYFKKHPLNQPPGISSDLKVVVPVYLEEETLPVLIDSLLAAANSFAKARVEVILVFNYPDFAPSDIISRQLESFEHYTSIELGTDSSVVLTCLKDFDVPKKQAGVGHARKTGMDYAAYTFAHHNRTKGIIVSLDADCIVSTNYFESLVTAYSENAYSGCNIYYEHPLSGSLSSDVYMAIAEYELHLRYYVQALRYAGFPYAFHTVGSCFSVTAEAYIKAGGMPSKQAGEDFYFLQKVIPQGNFGEVNSTIVFPSSRPSSRVPFGTGPSVNELVQSGGEYHTYNLQAFIDLKEFLQLKDELYELTDDGIEEFTHQLSGRMRSYLIHSDFFQALKPVRSHCSSIEVFRKRFYEVFNAFRVVKYLNYTHAHFLEKMPVFDASINLYELHHNQSADIFEVEELLTLYRQQEKQQSYSI